MSFFRRLALLTLGLSLVIHSARAADAPLPGHSGHGEVFDAGPRQAAYLMSGMSKLDFPATSKHPEVQAFINQGVSQLHGFWYFEAERSFRQAAKLDPECAIAYWGMAQANIDNGKRARGFVAEAVKRKEKASPRERLYIEALDAFLKEPPKDKKEDKGKEKERNKERHIAYAKALEKLIYEFPDDIEARAFLALQLWKNRNVEVKLDSYLAVDALYDKIFEAQPLHPAHHYRIHLWDAERAQNALTSAANSGRGTPGIAHMWHMEGHIYSRLKRYDDACWSQEASARVDHAHMMRDRVLPDQIHNYAHNQEWFIRNMIHVGRAHDALSLARNLCELPRHPKFNTLAKASSSAGFGKQRLFDVLVEFDMWSELLALLDSPDVDPGYDDGEVRKHLRLAATAHFARGELEQGRAILARFQSQLEHLEQERRISEVTALEIAQANGKTQPDAEQERQNAGKPWENKIRDLERTVNELAGREATARGDYKGGLERLKKAGGIKEGQLIWIQALSGDGDGAEKAGRKYVDSHGGETMPLAILVRVLWHCEKKEEARKAFEQLREISGTIDLEAPAFAHLAPIAKALGFPEDWRIHKPRRADVGERPALASLGPFCWQPSPALSWNLPDNAGQLHSLSEFRGRPVVLIFFLGNGCLHCAEQLHAFAKAKQAFDEAGIALFAVSSDDREGLKRSIDNYKVGPLPIPLVADPDRSAFKAYRCFDDFEDVPLHGTFLIDGAGFVRWQDIGPDPFMDHRFLLAEAKRLLGNRDAQPSLRAISSQE